eukprot:1183600-Prorocentrum_minimum.AAC.3
MTRLARKTIREKSRTPVDVNAQQRHTRRSTGRFSTSISLGFFALLWAPAENLGGGRILQWQDIILRARWLCGALPVSSPSSSSFALAPSRALFRARSFSCRLFSFASIAAFSRLSLRSAFSGSSSLPGFGSFRSRCLIISAT